VKWNEKIITRRTILYWGSIIFFGTWNITISYWTYKRIISSTLYLSSNNVVRIFFVLNFTTWLCPPKIMFSSILHFAHVFTSENKAKCDLCFRFYLVWNVCPNQRISTKICKIVRLVNFSQPTFLKTYSSTYRSIVLKISCNLVIIWWFLKTVKL
jgi:hypothetical protein